MGKKVRDPIHGYIYLTNLEAHAASDRAVLRLHNIHQNSFTYLTYPSTHNTRYPHSLGVLHVTALMFNNGLTNLTTTPGSFVTELRSIARQVDHALAPDGQADALNAFLSNISLESLYSYDPFYKSFFIPAGISQTDRVLIIAFAQAIRLAALLHDIGHPPYSHIVEYALQHSIIDYAVGGKTLTYSGHEIKSLELARQVRMRVIQALDDTPTDDRQQSQLKDFYSLVFNFAIAICDKDSPIRELQGFRRTLFSGDVDPDRIDYVTRDINAAGLSILNYDLGRLLDACQIHQHPSTGQFELRMTTGCLSSVELFFQARFHLYRWMIYHHDVVRRNLALQRTFDLLFDRSRRDGFDRRIIELCDELGKRAADPEFLDQYYGFVDGYLQEFLYKVYELVKAGRSAIDKELTRFLEIVLFRQKSLLSLWKRADEYHRFCEGLFDNKAQNPITLFNSILRNKFNADFKHLGKKGRLNFAIEIERLVNPRIKEMVGGRVYVYSFADFTAGPRDFQVWGYNRGIPVTDISPTLSSLETAWDNSPQLMIYCESEPGIDAHARVDKVRSEVIAAFKGLPEIDDAAKQIAKLT